MPTTRKKGVKLIIDETLRDLEREFGELFIRVHRNALVAARHIVALDRLGDGHYQIRLSEVDENIDISRRHVASVRKFVKSL